jgi:membrane-associated phospholipid phosphatase
MNLEKKQKISFWKSDLNQLWFDFKFIYPTAFSRIFARWQLSLILLFAVFSSFYFDQTAQDILTSLKGDFADKIFNFGRWYGSGNPTLYLFILLYIGGFLFKFEKIRDTGLLIGESFIFAGFISVLFKSFFGRWRPYANQGDFSFYGFTWSDNDHLSFTSGHANVAFALSMSLAAYAPNLYLKIFFYVLAVITCLSRIYHNQHWLSDVVVGAMISIVISNMLISFRKDSARK